jgi:hypothetical protein
VANLTLPATPAATLVNPSDLTWIWQNGALKSVPVSLVIGGLGQITNAQLAAASNNTLLSNISGGSASPADNTLTSILDSSFGTSPGTLLIRGSSAWSALAAGSSGQLLMASGAAPPSWGTQLTSLAALPAIGPLTLLANITGGPAIPAANGLSGIIDAAIGHTAGSILVRDPSLGWTLIAPGTSGYVLVSNGPGANPTYQSVAGTGTVTSVGGSGGTTGLTLTGGNITSSGTLTLGGTLNLLNGGTGSTSAAGALGNLGAAAIGVLVNIQTFSVSGTYTPTTGATKGMVWCQGPGGGGGGVKLASTGFTGAGNGSSGGFSAHYLSSLSVQTVTIGTGGTAGASTGTNGGNGSSNTSFGALCIANAGNGGTGSTTGSQNNIGASGPAAGTGNLWTIGGASTATFSCIPAGGTGISQTPGPNSFLGQGGAGSGTVAAAIAGANGTLGGGGTGAVQSSGTTGAAGGTGGNGLCIIFEFA